jgi:HSP20 family protein
MALIRQETRPSEMLMPRTWGPMSLFESMNRLLDETFGDLARPFVNPASSIPCNLYETDEALVLEMAAAGLNPQDLEVSLEGNKLTIRGQAGTTPEGVRRYYLQEIPQGSFIRSFILPVAVEGDSVKAEFKNGILRLQMPKVVEARAKRIPVQMS